MDNPYPMVPAERLEKGLWWGKALTLVEGCSHVSPACPNCWAQSQTHIRSHQANKKIKKRYVGLTDSKGNFNGVIREQWEALRIPGTIKKPTVFAVWNDLFHEKVSSKFINSVLFMMQSYLNHRFIVLTKRPDRARNFLRDEKQNSFNLEQYPKNMVLGVTLETMKYSERVYELLNTPATTRLISYEPALELIDFRNLVVSRAYGTGLLDALTGKFKDHYQKTLSETQGIDWLIMGCESGGNRRPMDIEWVSDIQKQCEEENVSLFLKQISINGKVVKAPFLDGKQYLKFPNTLLTNNYV